MNDQPHINQREPLQLNYRSAHADRKPAGEIRAIWWVIGGCAAFLILFSVFVPSIGMRRGPAQVAKCASNLKNIAAAMIEYANKHNAHYPDSFEELIAATGATTEILVCPASNDEAATGTLEEQTAALSAGGHCSYIYMGKGLTSDAPAEVVLAYEPPANHASAGMNVLFGDFHIEFIQAAQAQAMLKSIVPGKPLVWPPGSATVPTTQGN